MLLGVLFFLVAALYSSVGFGGGSSYLALLILWDVSYVIIPAIALVCNICVVSGNSLNYLRAECVNWRLLLPPTIASLPFAYLGGQMVIKKEVFVAILFATLLIAGIRLLINYRQYDGDIASYKVIPILLGVAIGSILGFLSGLVGIGGGIFLAPILYNLRAGPPNKIAATASVFILMNSISGLAGQLQKKDISNQLIEYWYLPLLVIVAGQIGNRITIKFIPERFIALLTALLVLFVAARLGWSALGNA